MGGIDLIIRKSRAGREDHGLARSLLGTGGVMCPVRAIEQIMIKSHAIASSYLFGQKREGPTGGDVADYCRG